jgi:hypothetical protein
MFLNLLMALVGISAVISAGTLIMVFGLRSDMDGLLSMVSRIEALSDAVEAIEDRLAPPTMHRVTIARDHELPDELEAMMERRAQKPPMN